MMALAGVLMLIAPMAAWADDPVSLRFAYPAPAQGLGNVWGFTPWAKEVGEASGGALEIKIFAGPTLGDYNHVYDRTITGVTDMAYVMMGPVVSDFPKASVATLPFEAANVEESGLGLWRLYTSGVVASEFAKVHLLALFTYSDSGLHTRKPVKTLEDIEGMKFAVGTRVLGEIVQRLGGTAIATQPSDIYQSLNRRLVDGAANSWPAVYPFKLQEVTSYHLDAPLGPAPALVVMNRASYAKLPAQAKRPFDGLSGDALTKRMTKAAARMDSEGRDNVSAMAGHVVSALDANEAERWKARLKPVTEEWVKATPDGTAVLAAYRSEIEKIRRGK
jgi:TRAP-type C4-dicarboxylate transport system substrate-binding protein